MKDPIWLVLLLPILGALICSFSSKQIGKVGTAAVGCLSILSAFLVTISQLFSYTVPYDSVAWTWMRLPWSSPSGFLEIPFGAYVDGLTLAMLSVVTGVAFLIHAYAAEYMKEEKDYGRFFACLNLFVATMVCLVIADNFAMLLIGWGGVGFASYSLIGFYNHKPSAVAASRKAFVVNTLGDVGLMLAIYAIASSIGGLTFKEVFAPASAAKLSDAANFITMSLLVAAYAKSAQLPLHTWLPDAMEGPTPVSALIHAATMVTAGVYLVCRCHTLFELSPGVLESIALAGGLTAIVAALSAMFQTDLKRILAYSTMSQLGYMFMAAGVGAYTAAIFHLVTHAFFKALLFLSAGAIIHSVHGEQDITKMGGLSKKLGATHWVYLVGSLALAGIPPLAGFFSKEEILGAVYHSSHPQATLLFGLGVVTAGLTAYYSTRAYCLTFRGEGDPQTLDHLHQPSGLLILPLLVLAALTCVAGFASSTMTSLLNLSPAIPSDHMTTAIALAVVAAGIGFGYNLHGAGKDVQVADFPKRLLTSCFFIDELQRQTADRVLIVTKFCQEKIDKVFSVTIPSFIGETATFVSRSSADCQSGSLRIYAGSILAGTLSFLLFTLWFLRTFSGKAGI